MKCYSPLRDKTSRMYVCVCVLGSMNFYLHNFISCYLPKTKSANISVMGMFRYLIEITAITNTSAPCHIYNTVAQLLQAF